MYNSCPTKKVVTNDRSSHECIHFKVFLSKKDFIEKCVVILILKSLEDSVIKVIS